MDYTLGRVCVYQRVSTHKQDEETKGQSKSIYDYIQTLDNQPTHLKHFTDVMSGVGKKGRSRPNFNQMIKETLAGKWDTIICDSVDRFSREPSQLLKHCTDLYNAGVQVVFVKQKDIVKLVKGNKQQEAMAWTFLSMFGAVAAIEREMIAARTRDMLQALKNQGKHVGRPKMQTEKRQKIEKLINSNQWTITEIAKKSGVSPRTIDRIKSEMSQKKIA